MSDSEDRNSYDEEEERSFDEDEEQRDSMDDEDDDGEDLWYRGRGGGDKDKSKTFGENVRDDFEQVINNNVDFGGDFSYHQEFPDAPNPVLNLTKLGVVGLPLSAREAAAIKKECKQAPFGKGERTVVDKKVRDTWELDASKVKFSNPKWATFVDDVVKKTCRALGVDFASSKPRCELYKLLLYEKGSHFLPHVDTEKVDGMFATIVIVLPSAFTGGAAHLSHNGKSAVYDCAKASKMSTSVMAWYTDITHEIKPVKSGYRLALSYNLIHTTRTLRPAIQTNARITANLERIFRDWKKDTKGERSPRKIIYRLDHGYSQANLNGSALKGRDAERVALLQPIAKKFGFNLGLAHVKLTLHGLWNDGSMGDDAPVRFLKNTVSTNRVDLTHFVDLDGTLISENLEFFLREETVPEDIGEGLERAKAAGEEYEEYTGNDGGDLERWYYRGALIIWNSRDDFDIRYTGKEGWERAFREFRTRVAQAAKPSAHDKKLIEVVFRVDHSRSISTEGDIYKAVGDAAFKWNDVKLWNRIAASNTFWNHTSDPKKWESIAKWGFAAVKSRFDDQFSYIEDYDIPNLAQFLVQFNDWLDASQPSSKGHTAASVEQCKTWIQKRLRGLLDNLNKTWPPSWDKFLTAVFKLKGPSVLTDSLLEKIQSITSGEALCGFAWSIHRGEYITDAEEKSKIVTSTIETVIARANLHVFHDPYHGYRESPDTQYAQVYIDYCERCGCEHLIPSIINKLADTSKLKAKDAQEMAEKLMSMLVAYWTKKDLVTTHASESLENLRKTTVDLILRGIKAAPKKLSKEQMVSLLRTAIKNGDTELLTSEAVPRLKAMPVLTEDVVRPVFQKLRPTDFGVSQEQLQTVLESILAREADAQTGDVRSADASEHEDAPAAKKRKTTKRK